MNRRDLVRLAIAVLLGAAIAFPIGMMVAENSGDTAPSGRLPAPSATREVFSPDVRSDPYFLDQQRQGVEALEEHCRRTGEMCAEARASRRMLGDLQAGD